MKTLRIAGLALVSLLALARPALGQQAPSTAVLGPAVAAAQRQYAAAFGTHSELYNGPEYQDYSKRYHASTGHQFFLSPEKQPGGVYYNDHDFSNIKLTYDLVLDQVVLSPPQSPLMLRLLSEKVREFTIGGRHFVRLEADSASQDVIHTGFYEVLIDSTVQVLARRVKVMQEHVTQTNVDVEFTESDKLFMRKAGRYYPVSSKASVLHLLADRSKELQKYAQEHKLKFKKTKREAAILALATYYSSLPPR